MQVGDTVYILLKLFLFVVSEYETDRQADRQHRDRKINRPTYRKVNEFIRSFVTTTNQAEFPVASRENLIILGEYYQDVYHLFLLLL